MSLTKFVGLLAGTALASSAFAASVESNTDAMSQIAELKKEIAELKSQNSDKWLTEQRADEIRSVVQDVLSDADTRSSLQAAAATSGYNNGFFISSPDGNFKLQINGQLQNRWAYNWLSTRDMTNSSVTAPSGTAATPTQQSFQQAGISKAAYGFEVRRAKLEFSGHISDPSWQYAITMAYQQFFGQNNVYANAANGAGNYAGGGGVSQGDTYAGGIGLENAYVKKDLGNGFSVQVGQFKSPFLREWLVSSKYQLTVERSLVNTLFSTGWTQGVQANWNNDNLRVMASYNDGANNANLGSTFGTNQDAYSGFNSGVGFASWAFTGRAEFMAFGNWAQFDQLTSMRGQAAGLLVGGGINWQRGGADGQNLAPSTPTANTNTAANGNADGEFFSWTVDATWQLGGANLYGAWVMNTTYGQPNGQGNVLGYGLVVQGGYFITDAIELFGRWEWMSTSSANGTSTASDNISENSANSAFVNNIGTIGANWYISKNVKFTTDFGVSWNPVTFQQGIFGQNIAGADYRTEGSNGGGQLVFRSQLQLLF
jgi:hypothetical protein